MSHSKTWLSVLVAVFIVLGLARLDGGGVAEASCFGSPTVTFINPGGGAWNVTTNWSTGKVPAPTDDVCIDAINGTPVSVTLDYTVAVDALSIGAGSTLTLSADSGSAAEVLATTYINDAGTITLTSVPVGTQCYLEVQGPAGITVATTGFINVVPGNGPNGGGRAIIGSLTNNGTINISQTLGWEMAGSFVNTVTNNGLITISNGAIIDFLPGQYAFVQAGGAGIDIGSPGAFRFSGPFTYDKGAFTTNPPVLYGGATLTFAPGAATNLPEFLIQGSVTLLSDIPVGAVLRVQAQPAGGTVNASLTAAGNVTNNGAIWLDSVSSGSPPDTSALITAPTATITNAGVIKTIPGSGGNRLFNANIINNGTIDLGSSTHFSDTGAATTITNTGTFTVETGTVASVWTGYWGIAFNQSGGTLDIKDTDGFVVGNYGTLNITGGTFPTKPPMVHQAIGLLTYGASPPAGGTVVMLSGTLGSDIPAGQTLDVQGRGIKGSVTSNASFTNRGTITMDPIGTGASVEIDLYNSGTMLTNAPTGIVNANGTGAVDALQTAFTNQGTVNIASGAILTSDVSYLQTAGLTMLKGATSGLTDAALAGLTIQGGKLGGFGVVTGNVVNGGEVSPGASPGLLTITGNYSQAHTGTLTIELAGVTVGTQFDQLAVSGTATLDGVVNVSLINGFNPVASDAFEFLTGGSVTGTFSTANGPTGMSIAYSPTFVTAKVPMQVTPTDAGAEGGSVDAGSQDAAAGDAGGPGDSGAAADATAPPDAGDDGGGFMVDASLADGGTAANTKSGCSCVVGAGGEGASGSLFLGLLAVAAAAVRRPSQRRVRKAGR
jgi:MYXO-CTERM domain-containing protein